MLNPFAMLEKLVNEHGSANILRERLGLAADQFTSLEKETMLLKQQLRDAEIRHTDEKRAIQSENERLHAELEQARVKIRDLENQLAQPNFHDAPLDEPKKRIIGLLAEESKTTQDLAELTGLALEAITFHLEDERMRRLAAQTNLGLCVSVALTPEGRQYAARSGLLKTR